MIPEATRQCNKKYYFVKNLLFCFMERIGWVTKLDYIAVVLDKKNK